MVSAPSQSFGGRVTFSKITGNSIRAIRNTIKAPCRTFVPAWPAVEDSYAGPSAHPHSRENPIPPAPKKQLNNAYSTDKPFLCFTAASELFLAGRAAILSRNPADQGEAGWGCLRPIV